MKQEPPLTRAEASRWMLIRVAGWLAAILLLLAVAAVVALAFGNFQRVASTFPAGEAITDIDEQETLSLTPGVMYPVHGNPAAAGSPVTPPMEPAPAKKQVSFTNPSWLKPPVPEFPTAAQRAGVGAGRVILTCNAMADGRISECSLEETPTGVGFGAAALAATKAARLNPRRVDDVPTGSQIRFATRFSLAGPDDQPPAERRTTPNR